MITEVKGRFYFDRLMFWSEIDTIMVSVKKLRIIILFIMAQ